MQSFESTGPMYHPEECGRMVSPPVVHRQIPSFHVDEERAVLWQGPDLGRLARSGNFDQNDLRAAGPAQALVRADDGQRHPGTSLVSRLASRKLALPGRSVRAASNCSRSTLGQAANLASWTLSAASMYCVGSSPPAEILRASSSSWL